MKTPIIILAAGRSKRLGQVKQLLPYKGSTLLGFTIQECLESGLGEVHVILGANAESIEKEISKYSIKIHYHEHWIKGMGSTIAFAAQIFLNKEIDGLVFCVGDQVHLNRKIIRSLIQKQKSSKASIVLSKYKEGSGPPSYFEGSLFQDLIQIKGDKGAKALVAKHMKVVQYVDFELGMIDVDRSEDLIHLE